MAGRRWATVLACWLLVPLAFIASAPIQPGQAPGNEKRVTATLDGEVVDLARGWEGAGACLYWPERLAVVECFRTEEELDARVVALERPPNSVGWWGDVLVAEGQQVSGGLVSGSAVCSGYLQLYGGIGYGSPVLYLRVRFQWLNLSSFGFDNETSSYKVGPCASYFADLSHGGGDWYPTHLTGVFDQSSSMMTGWNNDVSSVYMN